MGIESESRPETSIEKTISEIHSTSIKYNLFSLNRQIEICENLLNETDRIIDVAVLGQFKAGKSSFLNSLTSKNILPVGVIPVTTVITRLQYGPNERATVKFSDGTSSSVKIEDIGEYVSESGNPSNSKSVMFVDVELLSMIGYEGLRFVDTPGLGSVFEAHIKESENWLPEAGAAILAISADRPLSSDDLDLVRDLLSYTPNIFILMTKADLLTPAQQAEVTDFLKRTLLRETGLDFLVFHYSTKENTQTLRKAIDEKILSHLSENRDAEYAKILEHKTKTLLRNCISYLEIALKSSLEGNMERESLKNRILNERTGYQQISRGISVVSRDNKNQTRTVINNHLKKFIKPLSRKLTAELEAEMKSWRVNLWKMTIMYKDWLRASMTREISKISKEENRHFYATLNSSHDILTRHLENFRMHLENSIERALGVKLAKVDWKIDVVEPANPDIKILYAFDIHIDQLWFLIPMFIFRKLFERHFLNQVPWSVEVNLSRLATQWEEKINRAIDSMMKQTLKYIQDELSTIESLLSGTHCDSSELSSLIESLSAYLKN